MKATFCTRIIFLNLLFVRHKFYILLAIFGHKRTSMVKCCFIHLQRERAYPSTVDRDFSIDRPDPEDDPHRRRVDKGRDGKVDRSRKDYETDVKDVEYDSKDLDGGQRKRKLARKMDGALADTQQGGVSTSTSPYDDKDALKSES
jgi:hypothetical protein